MGFAPEYLRLVLRENFEDARRYFVEPLFAIHRAHLVMLAERGIISAGDAHALAAAIDEAAERDIGALEFDGSCEDLFFCLDRFIADSCGGDLAGRLHTARSRNDIDVTMYRLVQRASLLDLTDGALGLRRSLTRLADDHRETILAAHTHAQPAQPTTVAHYLLAAVEQLERDAVRLRASFATTNRCPLGACAITGTGFPIDRHLTTGLLGFDQPTGNTYGSIATVDYLLEGLGAASTLLVGLGRLLQDLLLWSTPEFGYLQLGDGFVQGSSIMPQKRNPVALEHARALASKALGEALGAVVAVHNTPFGDVVDTEDDLQPLVFGAFRDATRATSLAAAALADARFDTERLAARAEECGISFTELADSIVRDHGLPFRVAHLIAARLARFAADNPGAPLARACSAASEELAGRRLEYTEERLREVLSARNFIEVRRTHGGPAPSETDRALAAARAALTADETWLSEVRRGLDAAEARLRERFGRL